MADNVKQVRGRLAQRLQLLRKFRGLSQEVVAERAGLNRTYVSGVERSKINVRIANIEKFAQALDMDARDFFLETMSAQSARTSTPSAGLRNVLGDGLRVIRRRANISQERLAEEAGFHRSYVGSVERGVANVSIDDLQTLAKVLNVDVGEMFEAAANSAAETGS